MDLQQHSMGQLQTSSNRHFCRWIISLYFLTTILITSSEQAVYPQQPKVSACDENGQSDKCVCNTGDVRCINLNPKLLAVPMNIPSNVKALGLTQNNILQIEEYDFTGLERLESIFLQDNNISYIHPYAFRALYRLKVINLERNKLTQLDPTGTMFQYLASMEIVAVQQNSIYYLKGYSFFSMVRRFGELTVKFSDNPIMCDCSVRAIRDWVRNQAPQGSIFISGLKCANDPQQRPYDQVEDALFGNCDALAFYQSLAEVSREGNERNARRKRQAKNDKNNQDEKEVPGLGLGLGNNGKSDSTGNSNGNGLGLALGLGNSGKNDSTGNDNGNGVGLALGLGNNGKNKSNDEGVGLDIGLGVGQGNNEKNNSKENDSGNPNVDVNIGVDTGDGKVGNDTAGGSEKSKNEDNNGNNGQGNVPGDDMTTEAPNQEGSGSDTSANTLQDGKQENGNGEQGNNETKTQGENNSNNGQGNGPPDTSGQQPPDDDTTTEIPDKSANTENNSAANGSNGKAGNDKDKTDTGNNGNGKNPTGNGNQGNSSVAEDNKNNKSNESDVIGEDASIDEPGLNGNNSEDMFESITECPVCAGERTHHGCLHSRREQCIGTNMVCRQTVVWNNQDLSISSSCDSYNQCLSIQDNVNKISCGLDFQGNGNFNCVFCCVGPTCQEDSIGGRVVDYTVFLTYYRNNVAFQSYMNDSGSPQYLQEETRIDIGVRNTLTRLKGGVDAYVIGFEAMPNQQLKVKLRLEVTTFSTFTMSDVLQTINRDIKSSLERPSSFFSLDGVVHIVISSTASESGECPRDTTTHPTKGSITWDAVFLDTTTSETKYSLCPYQVPFATEQTFAVRTCAMNSRQEAEWGPVDYDACVTKEEQDDADTSPIFTKPIPEVQARNVSAFLLKYTSNYENMTPKKLNNVVNALEQLTGENMLQQPEVVSNVMGCVNNLLNVDDRVLRESQDETATSKRLLKVIDNVAELTPLETGNKLKVVTPNIAVAAQGIGTRETRDVMFTANTAAGEDLDSNQIDVGFQSGTSPPSADGSTMVIPTKALIDSLAPEDQRRMGRFSFAVHGTDKLFSSMGEDEKARTRTITVPPPSFADDEDVDVVDDSKDDDTNSDGSKTEKPPKEKSFTVVRKVNSHVISASVPGVVVKDLDDNITMTFEHEDDNATNAQCVYWEEARKGGEGRWSSEGCGIVETSEGKTTCGCNHLTNFALLMDVYQEGSNLSDLDRKILSIISYVGCAISLFALILTLLTYSLFRKLRRDNPSKILINLCLALLLSNLVFLVGMHDYAFQTTASCKAVAVLLHYFLLASLSWMAVEAFYMYLALVLVFKTYFTNFILKCSLVGWGVPLVIVIATLAINTTDNYGFINSGLCWLKNPAFYGAFVAPVCLILLVNSLAFCLVVKQLRSMSSAKLNKTDRNSTVQRLRGAVGVVILLGLSWLFAIFAIDQASVVFYYFFAVFNSLQGLFIFIFYCLLKKDAMTAWKRSLPCCDEYGESSKTSSNSKAAYQTATAHHMNKHNANSGSSTSMNNTTSTNSTAADSRKNSSLYNSVSSGNVYANIAEEDPDEGHQYKKTGSYDVAPMPDRKTDPHTYSNMRYEKNNDMELTKAGYPDPGSGAPKGAGVSPPKVETAVDTTQTPPQPYTFNIDTAGGRQPTAPSFSYLTNPNSASPGTPQKAQGEIDYSRPAGVSHLRLRYERTNSDTSDLEVTRI